MALTVESFLMRFPEFAPTDSTVVSTKLASAELTVSDAWGAERDEIVALTLAADLARLPVGRAAQLSSQDGESTYSRDLARRQKRFACCLWRLG